MSNFIYLSGIFGWIGEKVVDGIASFFYFCLLWLNCIIYSFITTIYKIFLILAQGGSIFDQNKITGMVDRVYVIIGVVILFLVAYSLLKGMVNPDEALKGKKSPVNIVKDVIISIALIAVIPWVFEFAFAFQNSLLTNNVIGKLIIGNSVPSTGNSTTDPNEVLDNGGYEMASGVWKAFLYVSPDGDQGGKPYCRDKAEEDNSKTSTGEDCTTVYTEDGVSFGTLWENAKEDKNFWGMLSIVPRILDDQVTYLFIIDIFAGAFVLVVLLIYCLDMAVRLVKLAVYELIAPIPILARIIPNEQASKVFSNWVKATLSTFAEVFIRIAILYFAVEIISIVGSSIGTLFTEGAFGSGTSEFFLKSIAQALIIIGIILFVKQAPEILKEITGLDAGKYNPIKTAMQAASMIGGGVTAAVRNWNDKTDPKNPGQDASRFRRFRNAAAGLGSGAFRSMWDKDNVKDFKSMRENATNSAKKAIDAHNKRVARTARYQSPDQSRLRDMKDSITTWAGVKSSREALEAKKKVYDEAVGFQKELFDLAADNAEVLALEGQKKAAAEKIIDRDKISQEIADNKRKEITNRKRLELQAANPTDSASEIEAKLAAEASAIAAELSSKQSDIDSETTAKLAAMRKAQADEVDLYDNLIKVAKMKVIQDKIKTDGRYKAVSEKAKVFKAQHMDDEVVQKMTTDMISDFASVDPAKLDQILASTDLNFVKNQVDILKGKKPAGPGDIASGPIGMFADNESFKIASGDQTAAIAKLMQEEKGKEAEKK